MRCRAIAGPFGREIHVASAFPPPRKATVGHRSLGEGGRRKIGRVLAAALIVTAMAPAALAQRGRGAGPGPQAAQSPQAFAPIDLTGYWVSIVNEDWRWRMVTPLKEDVASVPLNAEGRKVAASWDPATDGSCLAYGAAALMRMPTRLHITWENENTLRIDTDAGTQTRRLLFTAATSAPAVKSLQGFSRAEWERVAIRGGARGGASGGGNLKVVTANLTGGWLRKNGVPYSDQTTVIEYFDRFAAAGNSEWLVVTTAVTDPKYLTQEFVTSTHFRREPDGSKWFPTACR
jgi:hypothetical protein